VKQNRDFHLAPRHAALRSDCLWRCGGGNSRSARGAQCHAAPLRGALRSHGYGVSPKPPRLAAELYSAVRGMLRRGDRRPAAVSGWDGV